ncbi:12256_t:CDS:2 [Funneliformis geosporum]|nr:12256_t:CDS:2 [Funneliformis geosporum]
MLAAQNQRRWTNSCQHIADRKLTKWILHSTKPIETVNDSFLEDFLCYLNPNYKLPNEKNLKLLIHQSYDWTESTMRELLIDAIDQLAIELTRDLDNIIRKDGKHLKSINLSDDEWIFMESLVNLLALFEEATTFLSGSNYATLSLMCPTIFELKKVFNNQSSLEVVDFTNEVTILDDDEEFEQLENNDNDEVIDPTTKQRIKISQPMPTNGKIEQIKDIISQALNKYWSIQSDIALKAAFLDPRFKHLSFARDEKERVIQLLKDELQENRLNDLSLDDLQPSPFDDSRNINNMNKDQENELDMQRSRQTRTKRTLFSRIFSNISINDNIEDELSNYNNMLKSASQLSYFKPTRAYLKKSSAITFSFANNIQVILIKSKVFISQNSGIKPAISLQFLNENV